MALGTRARCRLYLTLLASSANLISIRRSTRSLKRMPAAQHGSSSCAADDSAVLQPTGIEGDDATAHDAQVGSCAGCGLGCSPHGAAVVCRHMPNAELMLFTC